MKIVFFGTPKFAKIILEYLLDFCEKSGFLLSLIVTRPDKPGGRGLKPRPSEVKKFSQRHNLPVVDSPEMAKVVEAVEEIKPDLLIVAAYMRLLPARLLNIPKHGGLNVHPSLLSKYAGVSPVQHAILNNEKKTGVTIIKMNPRYDEGKIVAQESLMIFPEETAPELETRLAHLGGKLLSKIIPDFIEGKISPKPQDLEVLKKYYTKKLTRHDAFILWTTVADALAGKSPKEAGKIARMIRAFNHWPGVWSIIEGKKRLKILKCHLEGEKLVIDRVQLEGKQPITWPEFVAGYKQVLDL